MTKITLTDLANLQNETTAVNAINNNNAVLETFSDSLLSRDGTSPNEMESVLDMNSHQIINLPSPTTMQSPLRLQELADFLDDGSIVVSPLPSGGTTGQVLTKISASDYDANWQTPKPEQIFYLSNYPSLQDACDATQAADGGIVFLDGDQSLLSGAVGLNLDNYIKPLRITGFHTANGGGGYGSLLAYAGTGTAISARNSIGVEFDHVYVTNSQANTVMFDFRDAVYMHVHDNTFVHQVNAANNVTIRLDNTQGARIFGNTFSANGGVGIVGVEVAFSVKAHIADNKFNQDTLTCISAPGNAWNVTSNIFQGSLNNVNQAFIRPGAAGTCDTLYLNGNDCDDGILAKTWVYSNAGCLISTNNRYTGALTTAIAQTNSTGGVVSMGDYLQGAVGVAIGTGNYLTILNYNTGVAAPTVVYTGTPAQAKLTNVLGGGTQIPQLLYMGNSGVNEGSIQFLHTAGGTNTLTSTASGGVFVQSLPNSTGTLLNTTNTATATNKTFTSPVLTTPTMASATGGSAAGSTMTLNGTSNGSPSNAYLLLQTNGQRVGIGQSTPLANVHIGPGSQSPSQASTLYVSENGNAVFTLRDSANSIETCLATNSLPAGLFGTRTNHPLYIQTNSANRSAFPAAGGLHVGSSLVGTAGVDGQILASAGIRSFSPSAGVGYTTGSGNTASQAANRSNPVTINTVSGAITTHTASLAAGAFATFTVNNSAVASTDTIILNLKSGGTATEWTYQVDAVAGGSFVITYRNQTGGALTSALVFQYNVIKGSNV